MMIDKIIDITVVMTVVCILIGLIIAVWFGMIGVKIAATALIILVGNIALYMWLRYIDLRKDKDAT